jgi:hypothetical protein
MELRKNAPKKPAVLKSGSSTSSSHPSSSQSSSSEDGRPPSLGGEILCYTPPPELNYPFGSYEFALSKAVDCVIDNAMQRCHQLEKDEKKCFNFNPIINKSFMIV